MTEQGVMRGQGDGQHATMHGMASHNKTLSSSCVYSAETEKLYFI